MPLRRNKVTSQTLAGEGGVAIIARRLNEMGYPWHDRRMDHGIDGEIKLVSRGRELAATAPQPWVARCLRIHTADTVALRRGRA